MRPAPARRRSTHWQAQRRPRQRGFSLLEAVVALTLLASAGAVLFGWLNQNLETMVRLREHDERSRLLLNAQALAATIDPLKTPEGQLEAADMRLSWRSLERQPLASRSVIEVSNDLQWRIGLYDLTVRAERVRPPALEVSFTMLQLGMLPPAGAVDAPSRP